MLPGEEPLPAMDNGMSLDQLQAMNGVNMTEEDMLASGMAPDAVANDVASQQPEVRRAEPNMQPTGAFMDLGFIQQINNAATDEEATAIYNALDPVQKRVYDRSYGININPEWAANEASKYYQEQDERAKMANSPQGQLAQRRIDQMDNEAMTARRDTMLTAQSMLDAASRIEQAVDNNLVGPWKDVEQKFDGSGLPFSDPDEYSQRKALEVQTKKSIIDAVQAFKGPLSDSDRKFFIEMFPTINEPVGVWKDYASQLKNKFSPIVKGQFDMPAAAQPSAAPAAAPQQTKQVGNQTWVRTPQGWVPQQ